MIKLFRCTQCLKEKEQHHFCKTNQNKRGFTAHCKDCRNEKKKLLKYPPQNILEKKCSNCKNILNISNFTLHSSRSDGYSSNCKQCISEKSSKYYNINKEIIKQKRNNYYHSIIKTTKKEEYNEKVKIYQRNRLKTDVLFRLKRNLRNRLYYALLNKNWKKNTNFSQYIGLQNQEELKSYLSGKFLPGMTWENYGKWEIDHIIPLSTAETKEELYKLCHYTNLQPLWEPDNISKSNKTNNIK